MYTGTNPTAVRSMDWIAEALSAKMMSVPYSKINIKDLCLAADVSRQTFYNLFGEKDDVLRYCLKSKYEKIFDGLAAGNSPGISEIIDLFIRYYEDNRPLLDSMIENHLEAIITEELTESISLCVSRFVKRGDDDGRIPYATQMLAGALAQLEVYLMKQGESIEHEKFAGLLSDFFAGSLYSMD